nr:hypothetical protein [Candidatus Sigynarchaeota archaeon]
MATIIGSSPRRGSRLLLAWQAASYVDRATNASPGKSRSMQAIFSCFLLGFGILLAIILYQMLPGGIPRPASQTLISRASIIIGTYQVVTVMVISALAFSSLGNLAKGNSLTFLLTLPVDDDELARIMQFSLVRECLVPCIIAILELPLVLLAFTSSPAVFIENLFVILMHVTMVIFLPPSIVSRVARMPGASRAGTGSKALSLAYVVYFAGLCGLGIVGTIFPGLPSALAHAMFTTIQADAGLISVIHVGIEMAGIILLLIQAPRAMLRLSRAAQEHIFEAGLKPSKSHKISVKISRPTLAVTKLFINATLRDARCLFGLFLPFVVMPASALLLLGSANTDYTLAFYWSFFIVGFLPLLYLNALSRAQELLGGALRDQPVDPASLFRAKQLIIISFTAIVITLDYVIVKDIVIEPFHYLALEISLIPAGAIIGTLFLLVQVLFFSRMHRGGCCFSFLLACNVVGLMVSYLEAIFSMSISFASQFFIHAAILAIEALIIEIASRIFFKLKATQISEDDDYTRIRVPNMHWID